MLHREDFILQVEVRCDTSSLKLLTLQSLLKMKTGDLAKDSMCLYAPQASEATELSNLLSKHEIKSLHEINDLQMRLLNKFNQDQPNRHIFVITELGEAGLCNLTDDDTFMLIDSDVIEDKKETIQKLKKDIAMSLVSIYVCHICGYHT